MKSRHIGNRVLRITLLDRCCPLVRLLEFGPTASQGVLHIAGNIGRLRLERYEDLVCPAEWPEARPSQAAGVVYCVHLFAKPLGEKLMVRRSRLLLPVLEKP
jgi:hypothetical protein